MKFMQGNEAGGGCEQRRDPEQHAAFFIEPEPPQRFGPSFEPRKPPWVKRKLAPIAVAVLALLAKLKTILVLLPKLKVLTTAGTMLVSISNPRVAMD